ncbi:MAG TPA: dihydroorotate dehydrogenase-like protein, partial [Deinococcales bacterium]|nr:dihydroorotate dehydrogenase-like protein [Deinococcales bacterium]
IASLNGMTPGGWTLYAREMEKAGADAIELNAYFLATDPRKTGFEVERDYVQILREVRSAVKVPVSVKLSPYFSSVANMAWQLAEGGADGLVLFNRFYQPDLDLENLTVTPALNLSTSTELRLPLRWLAILHGRVPVDLALTTGVHSGQDVVKGLMAGAKVTMVASELMEKGVQRIGELRDEAAAWMTEHEYDSVEQLTGSLSQARVEDPNGFERANYMKALQSWQPKNV